MTMLLAIDAGNSFVKWGYHDGSAWLNQARENVSTFCADPLHYLDREADSIMISNVAGAGFRDAMMRAMPKAGLRWVQAEAHACGVSNQYDDPTQLGSDRWAALIAVRAMTASPCIVASIGTALTVDMLSASGAFLGGMIAPGPGLMRQALAQGTDAIQAAGGKVMLFPTNTADAVETGVLYATVGAIERTAAAFEARAETRAKMILTGGAANIIAPFLNRPCQVVDNLVLEGLLALSREEAQK